MKRLLFCFCLLPSCWAFAAPPAQPALTWNDCVNELIAANPDLQAAYENFKKAQTDVMASYGHFLPKIQANASASKSDTQLDAGYQSATAYRANLSADQNLFNGFQDQATLRQSQALLSVAEIKLKQTKATLSSGLTQAFIQTLYAQDFLKLVELIAERRKLNLDMIELRFDAGRENKGSFLRIKAYHRQALFEISQAARGIKVAQQQLAAIMGRLDSANISVAGHWEIDKVPAPPDFISLAKTTPVYQIAAAQARAANEKVRIAASDFYPTWSLSGMIGRQDDESIIPNRNQWSIGTTISYPLFTGGQSYYALRGAQALRRAAQATLADTGNSMAATLEAKYTDWQNATEQTEVQAAFLQAAEMRAEIARGQYQNGLLSFQDWDTIENDLIDRQKAVLVSQRDAGMLRAAWEQTVGIGAIP